MYACMYMYIGCYNKPLIYKNKTIFLRSRCPAATRPRAVWHECGQPTHLTVCCPRPFSYGQGDQKRKSVCVCIFMLGCVTHTIGGCRQSKVFCKYERSKLVLPTPPSPTATHLMTLTFCHAIHMWGHFKIVFCRPNQ